MAETKLAYSAEEAAEQISKGVRAVYNAIRSGALTARYPDSVPIILHDELDQWLHELPTEKPGGDA